VSSVDYGTASAIADEQIVWWKAEGHTAQGAWRDLGLAYDDNGVAWWEVHLALTGWLQYGRLPKVVSPGFKHGPLPPVRKAA
jgi:hypothetical protein